MQASEIIFISQFLLQISGMIVFLVLILGVNLISRNPKKLVQPEWSRFMITGASYIFFFIQPDLIQSSLKQLTCKEIAGKKWIYSNLNLECTPENSRVYYKWAFPILFFELMMPLVILYVLHKELR